jgi:hypothetical protein
LAVHLDEEGLAAAAVNERRQEAGSKKQEVNAE